MLHQENASFTLLQAGTIGSHWIDMTISAAQPTLIHYFPIATTLVAAVFFSVLVRRYRAKRKGVHLLWWAGGVAAYGMGTGLESVITLAGNSIWLNKWWYVMGALLGAYPLAQAVQGDPAPSDKVPVETIVFDAPSTDADGDDGAFDVDLVPGYEIQGELGRGGMGVVYRARQTALNRIVALKMILAGGHASEDQLARFRTEAESVARLQHPNIVQIYDVGEQRGLPYFSLEFIDGKNLEDEIDGKPTAFNKAAGWIETIATAIHYAHEQGIVHRDLKPANILLTSDGIPKITDFGLAKNLESESSQTRTGTIMGTPSYMAPEQGQGTKHVGPLADVYALGAILYEMSTGRPPFLAATAFQTLMLLLKEEPVRPLQLRPDIPADLETIILKCLQKDSQKRYASAEDLALDLHRFLGGEPILARPVGRVERVWRWCRRNRLVASLTATAVLLLLGLAIGGSTAAVLVNDQRKIAVRQTVLAEKSEQRAIDNKQRAIDNERRAIDNERRAIDNERRAVDNERRAVENEQRAVENKEAAVKSAREAREAQALAEFNAEIAKQQGKLALQTLNSLVINVQNQLKDTAGTFELKRSLLQTALEGLRKVARTEEIDGYNADISIAVAHQRMGKILLYLGKPEEARDEYERFHKVIVAVSGPNPPLRSKGNIAISLSTLGDVSLLLGDREKASGYYTQSYLLRKEVADRYADDVRAQVRLATSYVKLGDAGDREQAEEN